MTSARHPGPSSTRVRRRRAVFFRHLLEGGTGWLLALLVGASIGLGAMLWSGALWSASPIVVQDPTLNQTYVGSDDVTQGAVQDVVTPERILLLYPGYHGDVALGAPTGSNGADFVPVWADLQTVLSSVQVSVAAAAETTGIKPLTEALKVYAAAPVDAGGGAVQADFGPLLTWSEWVGATQGPTAPPPAGDPEFERMIILPEHPGACGSVAAWLYLVAGTSVRKVPVAARVFAPLCDTISGLRYRTPDGYPLVPLNPQSLSAQAQAAVPEPAGFLVPEQAAPALAWWQPGRLRFESLDDKQATQLAYSLFPDPPWRTRDGNFTTSEGDALQIDPGSGRILAVFRRAEGPLQGWAQALDAAVGFINRTGGWPPTAWLSGAKSGYPEGGCTLAECSAPNDVTFTFSSRYNGLPVLAPDPTTPALTIQMSGNPAHPLQYSRAVPVPVPILGSQGGPSDGADAANPPPVGVAQAINTALQYPPPELIGDSGQVALQVTNVMPTYVPLPATRTFEPAWAVELDPSTGGTPVVVLVDRLNDGAVLGVWRPN